MFKGMETLVSSETLVQNTVGVGFPSAEQFNVNSTCAFLVRSFDVTMFFAGARK